MHREHRSILEVSMKYDFTSILDRSGSDAIAVNVDSALRFSPSAGMRAAQVRDGFPVIPMWIADMNFPTVPTVQEAIIRRTEHPAFGYFRTVQDYYDAIIRWQETRNGVSIIGNAPKRICPINQYCIGIGSH